MRKESLVFLKALVTAPTPSGYESAGQKIWCDYARQYADQVRTDAYAIWNKLGGIPSAILSIPNRYMHTTVEMLDLRDLQHTAELLAAFAASLKAGERFNVVI